MGRAAVPRVRVEGQAGQEESPRKVALGVSFVRAVEAVRRQAGPAGCNSGALGLLHAFVRDRRFSLQHAPAHADMIAQARWQVAGAI